MAKVSRSGRPIRHADVAADDALIDAVFTAPLHGGANIDDGVGGALVRRLIAVRCRPQDLADGPAAGFVAARSLLDRVIATLLIERPGSQPSPGRNVSAVIADAIEALDIAFETWLAVTEPMALVRADPMDGNPGGVR